MAATIKKSRKKATVKDDFEFDEEEDIDVCNLSEGEPILEGTLLRSFVFDDFSSEPIEVPLTSDNNNNNLPATNNTSINNNNNTSPINTNNSNIETNIYSNDKAASNLSNKKISSKVELKEDILDYRFSQNNPFGRTPPVDGEIYDMVRCYTLRRSTIRILSKIKVIHQDDNVYLNTIVDAAIRYYYEYLKNSNV